MKRTVAACLIAAMLAQASGCASLLDREYLVIQPHTEQKNDAFNPDDLTVNSRESLKSAILWLVENGYEEKTIRAVNYPGDPRADLPQVCFQITDEEPLGAYAVNYMSYEVSQVLAQYVVSININYRRTAAQIAAIRPVSFASGLSAELRGVLSDFLPSLTLEMTYYDPDMHDAEALLREEYYSNPQWAMGLPAVKVETFPQSGPHRIITLDFTFPGTAEELTFRARLTDARMLGMVGQLSRELTPPLSVLTLHDILCEYIIPWAEDSADDDGAPIPPGAENTLYGAAALACATSEGYALAFKRACDMLNIDCLVVCGYLNGDAHFWNVVYLVEQWYHIDCAADDISGGHEFFLRDDMAMEEAAYRWGKAQIPACPVGPLSYERILTEFDPSSLIADNSPPSVITGNEDE